VVSVVWWMGRVGARGEQRPNLPRFSCLVSGSCGGWREGREEGKVWDGRRWLRADGTAAGTVSLHVYLLSVWLAWMGGCYPSTPDRLLDPPLLTD
jgi:hypothetical protein